MIICVKSVGDGLSPVFGTAVSISLGMNVVDSTATGVATVCGTVQDAVEKLFGRRGELTGCSRKKSSLVNLFLIAALSMPCVLGYNVWSWDGFAVFGGAVLDFEDFLVSNLFLPLGSLVYLLFCVSRCGWGWKNYKQEVNTGEGPKMQDWMRGYLTYGLPLIVLFIFAFGLYDKFFA